MSLANQIASLIDQRDYFIARIRELGGYIVDDATFEQIVEAVYALYGIEQPVEPAYAAVYGGDTLVFGRGDEVPNEYNGKTLSASYRDIETSEYTASEVPWFAYNKNITTVNFKNKIKPISTAYWFYRFSNLASIDNIALLNTSNVANMSNMFNGCAITNLDLSSFDTRNVTNMSSMFVRCSKLATLNVSSFNTSNVTNMKSMFDSCSALTNLDLNSFDASNVANMSSMFYRCSVLTNINMNNFNTINVTDMSAMFINCSALITLDLSSFNTSSVTIMNNMFGGCSNLTTIYASSLWSTANVTNSTWMFIDCTKLVGGKGTKFNTSDIDKAYARIDGGASSPGYFTQK